MAFRLRIGHDVINQSRLSTTLTVAFTALLLVAERTAATGITTIVEPASPIPAMLEPLRPVPATSQLKKAQLGGPAFAASPDSSWQLVRTPGPDKARDIISTMRTADMLRSDPDFAGMMIRCSDKGGFQIGFVVIAPYQPRAKLTVSVSTGNGPKDFLASAVPPGALVTLPAEASAMLPVWTGAEQLKVEIDNQGAKVNGVIPLKGLSQALAQLQSSCVK